MDETCTDDDDGGASDFHQLPYGYLAEVPYGSREHPAEAGAEVQEGNTEVPLAVVA